VSGKVPDLVPTITTPDVRINCLWQIVRFPPLSATEFGAALLFLVYFYCLALPSSLFRSQKNHIHLKKSSKGKKEGNARVDSRERHTPTQTHLPHTPPKKIGFPFRA
jgi:hypothetical protein